MKIDPVSQVTLNIFYGLFITLMNNHIFEEYTYVIDEHRQPGIIVRLCIVISSVAVAIATSIQVWYNGNSNILSSYIGSILFTVILLSTSQ